MNHSAIKYELLNKWLPQSNSSFAAANETISDFNINLNSNAAGKSFIINIFLKEIHSIRLTIMILIIFELKVMKVERMMKMWKIFCAVSMFCRMEPLRVSGEETFCILL